MNTDQTNSHQMTNDTTQEPNSTETETSPDSNAADEAEEVEQEEGEQSLEDEIERLEQERDELNDRLLRKAAEFKNFRRRMEREKRRRYEAGKVAVIEPILEVLDNFERSIEAARDLEDSDDADQAYESLKGGVEMVFRKFQDELQSLGVEPIDAEGKPFDETLHEAMMRQPSEDAEPGTVLQEVRKGYTLEDRVIRHSRVVVAAEPPSDESDVETSEETATEDDDS